MTEQDPESRIHDLEATLRVGKGGIESVAEELSNQLDNERFVKVKFLRAARGGTTTEALATDLAGRVDSELVETRGHTAVYRR
jgi:RNA-binding protein